MKKKLFSDRYLEILGDSHFRVSISYDLGKDLYYCLEDFNEPSYYQPSRYDGWTEQTDVHIQVYSEFFSRKGHYSSNISLVDAEWATRRTYDEWADLIELWYFYLSDGEKQPFQNQVNDIFKDYDSPLRLIDGRIIKIDKLMFEKELKEKMLQALNQAKCEVPAFQNATDEYLTALENYQKGEFSECVFYAEKSYESAMKIVCGADQNNPDRLAQLFADLVSPLPGGLKGSAFKDKVLMSLPFLRNNLNVGHGAGMEKAIIPATLAHFCLNLCATLNTYIVEEYLSRIPSKKESFVELQMDDIPF